MNLPDITKELSVPRFLRVTRGASELRDLRYLDSACFRSSSSCGWRRTTRSPRLPAAREPLTVMSFNIRYGTAQDGDNHWTARRDMLFDLVRAQNADIIGLQEALDAQIREITAAAPGYAVVGVGRDDAQAKGEYSAILFRTRSAARGGVGHVLVFGHARGPGVEIVGEQHHAHLHVGAVHRSRRPRVLALQPAPGSPVAAFARAQHRAAAPPHRSPRVSTRAGRRHGRFQRRRRQPRASRAGTASASERPTGAVPRHVPRACTPTSASSARSPASSSGR